MLRYHIKLVYKDKEGNRTVSEFDVASWEAITRILQWLEYKWYELIFITISDNEEKTRLQGPKSLMTFYDLYEALNLIISPPEYHELSEVFKRCLEDYIKSHEVKNDGKP